MMKAHGSRALLLSAHPPGSGSGSGMRGAVSLAALRAHFERVDVASMYSAGEEELADPATHLIPRPDSPSALSKLTMLARGGFFYAPDRRKYLCNALCELRTARLLDSQYDLIWAHSAVVAQAAANCIDAKWRILDIDNIAGAEVLRTAEQISAILPRGAYRRMHARLCAREERRRASLCDCVVVPSELERHRLGSVKAPVEIVPNTISARWDRCRPAAAARELLFVGSLDYAPNIDAVVFLEEEILPRLRAVAGDVTLVVAGRNPVARVQESCSVPSVKLVDLGAIEPKPDSATANARVLGKLYRQARVVVAPLRLGGGTRFKVLEAMASSAAIVATPTAVEGLAIEGGVHALVADEGTDFADACLRLLDAPQLAAELGAAGYELWFARYRPESAMREIRSLIGRFSLGTEKQSPTKACSTPMG